MQFQLVTIRPDQPVLVLEQPSQDGWSVSVTIGFQHGHPIIAELKVFPTPLGSWKGEDSISVDQLARHPVLGTYFGQYLHLLQSMGATVRAPGTWANDVDAIEKAPAGGLTASQLRSLDLGKVLARARALAESTSEFLNKREPGSSGPWAENLRAAPKRPGRSGRDDYFYAQLAEWFVALIGQNVRGPVQRIAREKGASEHTVRDWLAEARKRGLLTKAAPGRTEGKLTEKAKALLEVRGSPNGERPKADRQF